MPMHLDETMPDELPDGDEGNSSAVLEQIPSHGNGLDNTSLDMSPHVQRKGVVEESLQFETFLAGLSTPLMLAPVGEIDREIEAGLGRVGEAFGFDCVTLAAFSEDLTTLRGTYRWTVPEVRVPPLIPSALHLTFPWYAHQLRQGHTVSFAQPGALPAEAVAEKQQWQSMGLQSLFALPFFVGEWGTYVISYSTFRSQCIWPEIMVVRLRLIGECFVHALMRKRAEETSRRLWHELAHAARVAMLGELSASLAHELNQPLTAILSNAQAAQRFLAMKTPDIEEVQQTLMDIIADDQRAGKIIQQVRALGKKEVLNHAPLDVNTLVQEVIHLVQTDALARQVTVSLDLDAKLPTLHGERIQLQQVILNLVLNAFEAMLLVTDPPRRLRIRTTRADSCTIAVSFQDSGIGADEATLTSMFNSFFTTKPEGMGMGLAVSRAIVKAHGGQLWAVPNPDCGITVWFTLPIGHEAGG